MPAQSESRPPAAVRGVAPVPTDAARPVARLLPDRAAPLSGPAPPLPVLAAEPTWLVRHIRSYPGRPDQVRHVRAFLREVLADYPRTDDAVTVGSELATNSVLHSQSGVPGGTFTVRAEVSGRACSYVSVADQGGRWDLDTCELVPEHGLDVVEAIAGPGNWGIAGDGAGHLVWARLRWPTDSHPAWAETDDQQAEADLDKLATELNHLGLWARRAGKPSHLEVCDPLQASPPARIYARPGWYYWPTAQRITARDDVATAARAVARALRPGVGLRPPR